MSMILTNLDQITRKFMESEVEHDIANDSLYLSKRLNEEGISQYPFLLLEAVRTKNIPWLASKIRELGLLNTTETRAKRGGGITIVNVPVTAPETLAEGEFNRFYCRGLCARAIGEGIENVQVYRAKEVSNTRPESEGIIGILINAKKLLADLRTSIGIEPALGIPPGPNSGLSVKFVS